MGSKLESLRSMKDEANDHIEKSVELSEFSANESRAMAEILDSLPAGVDDEILNAARSVQEGVIADSNEFNENEVKPELETGQQIMSEMTDKAKEQISKNDDVIDAFNRMDSIADFGSSARREGTQKAESLNESLYDLIDEGQQSLESGSEAVSANLDSAFGDISGVGFSEGTGGFGGGSPFSVTGEGFGEGTSRGGAEAINASFMSSAMGNLGGLFGNSNSSSNGAVLLNHSQGIVDSYIGSELGNYLSNDKKSGKMSDSVSFQNDKDFAAGISNPNWDPNYINGYANNSRAYVKNSGPHPEKTAIHEYNHILSANDITSGGNTTYRRGVSINGNDTQVNEALTEFFTKKMMGSEYPKNPSVAYMENEARIERMADGFGYANLKYAYYQNRPDVLENRFDSVMGAGSWRQFSQAMDTSLDDRASADARRRANNYLDSMSMIFAAKTRRGR